MLTFRRNKIRSSEVAAHSLQNTRCCHRMPETVFRRQEYINAACHSQNNLFRIRARRSAPPKDPPGGAVGQRFAIGRLSTLIEPNVCCGGHGICACTCSTEIKDPQVIDTTRPSIPLMRVVKGCERESVINDVHLEYQLSRHTQDVVLGGGQRERVAWVGFLDSLLSWRRVGRAATCCRRYICDR